MILIHGTHRFGQKQTGVRKDFCNSCEDECLSEQWQSFDFGHLFWIPLLPLGTRKRWLCRTCRQDPRARYRTRRPIKILGLFAVGLFMLAMYAAKPKPDEVTFIWGARIFFTFAFLGLLYSILQPPPPLTEDDRRKLVKPLPLDTCLYCDGPVELRPRPHCPSCQIEIFR